jgi:hypothetical protein
VHPPLFRPLPELVREDHAARKDIEYSLSPLYRGANRGLWGHQDAGMLWRDAPFRRPEVPCAMKQVVVGIMNDEDAAELCGSQQMQFVPCRLEADVPRGKNIVPRVDKHGRHDKRDAMVNIQPGHPPTKP